MADEEATQPPQKINTFRKLFSWLWTWGWAHTVISCGIIGALLGFIAGKVL